MTKLASALCFISLSCGNSQVPADVVAKFEEFEHRFGKNYAITERERRLAIFAENLGLVKARQEEDRGSAHHSHLTPFADLTPDELAARNGYLLPDAPHAFARAASSTLAASSTDFDWVARGAVNPIKDQSSCGSCWAFAAVANLEGAAFLAAGELLTLSEQQLVECDTDSGDLGCTGGLPEYALKHLVQDREGLETEKDYPYVGGYPYIVKCHKEPQKEKVFVGNWTFLSQDEDDLAAWLEQHGPIAIGINSISMVTYFSGVASPDPATCKPADLDHGVALVGFGVDEGLKYWKIRNSWGTLWGENGYYRIARGTGACGLNTAAVTALDVTVQGAPAPSPTPAPHPAPMPSPAPTPTPAPSPVEGDCTSQTEQPACLGTTDQGRVCTWCNIGGFGFCTVPDYSCNGGFVVM